MELSGARSPIQHVTSASSSTAPRDTPRASEPLAPDDDDAARLRSSGIILLDDLYTRALHYIWSDPAAEAGGSSAEVGSVRRDYANDSTTTTVAEQSLASVADRARLLFGRHAVESGHGEVPPPREGHCVPVPHMRQIEHIHPLQEVRQRLGLHPCACSVHCVRSCCRATWVLACCRGVQCLCAFFCYGASGTVSGVGNEQPSAG